MKVLVCGGRNYSNVQRVFELLDKLHAHTPITLIVNGAARGADSLSSEWARQRGVPFKEYPADWDKLGKSAGFKRNQQMLTDSNPDLVLAMPGGNGTEHMVTISIKAGKQVVRSDY